MLAVLTLPTQGGQPAAEATPEAPRPQVVVGGDQAFPPYEYLENEEPTGFNVELMRAVGQVMGFDVVVRLGPWTEVTQQLTEGKIDALAGLCYSKQRDVLYDFSIPHSELIYGLFTRGKESVSPSDLISERVMVQDGDMMHETLAREGEVGSLIPVNDTRTMLGLLATGQNDVAVLPKNQGMYLIRNYGLSSLRLEPVDFKACDYGFAVAEGNRELLFKLNEGLNLLKHNGEYNRLYRKWFGVYEDESGLPLETVGGVGVAVAVLILGVLGWNWSLRRQVLRRTQALSQSEDRYRVLMQTAAEGVGVVQHGIFVFWNNKIREMTGLSDEVLRKMPVMRIFHPDDVDAILAHYQRKLKGEDAEFNYTVRILSKGGEVRHLKCTTALVNWENGPAVLVMATDVTETVLAQEHVQRELRRMSTLRTIDQAISTGFELSNVLDVMLDLVREQLEVDAAGILLYSPETQRLKMVGARGFKTSIIHQVDLSLGESLAGRVARDLRPYLLENKAFAPQDVAIPEIMRVEEYSSYYAYPLLAKNELLGVLEVFHSVPLRPDVNWVGFFEMLAGQAAIAIDNTRLFINAQQANQDLLKSYDATILSLAQALELRDRETQGHSQRVTELSVRLAGRMKLTGEPIDTLRRGALLHDIGKIGIPDNILLKPGPLTEAEWVVMRQHPLFAQQLLAGIPFLKDALEVPLYHHERWNGSGYPFGLRGAAIPLAARIFSVVDVWDSVRHERPYKKAWPVEQARAYLISEAGELFDPTVVRTFIAMVDAGEVEA